MVYDRGSSEGTALGLKVVAAKAWCVYDLSDVVMYLKKINGVGAQSMWMDTTFRLKGFETYRS